MHVQRLRDVLAFNSNSSRDSISHSCSYLETISKEAKTTKTKEKDTTNEITSTQLFDAKTIFPSLQKQTTECLKAVNISSFSPIPASRRNLGHLIYLSVTTLEKEVLEIVGSVTGFYVSKSKGSTFDPSLRQKNCASHTLSECLSLASPQFKTTFTDLKESIRNTEAFETITYNHPYTPWCVSNQTHSIQLGNSLEIIFSLTNFAQLASRDWNEDHQTIRELPIATTPDRILRDQALIRQNQEFVQFATEAAIKIINKTIDVQNMSDCDSLEMYVFGNLFFSSGYDPKSHILELGGEPAARAACSKDIDNISAIIKSGFNISTLDTLIVDYKGTRMTVQTIIPGILKQQLNGSPVKYGLVDDDSRGPGIDVYANSPEFHTHLEPLSEILNLKEHSVLDDTVERMMYTSLESKGIIGNDGRKYLLDCYRCTPVDICFLESLKEEKELESSYPHQVCLIRREAITIYGEYKIRAAARLENETVFN